MNRINWVLYGLFIVLGILIIVGNIVQTADSQTPQVTVIGGVTPGHCTGFSSTLQLQDAGSVCGTAGVIQTGGFNFFTAGGATTGNPPFATFAGGDTNVNAFLQTKGAGNYIFTSNLGSITDFQINGSTTAVNFLAVTPTNTGNAPTLQATGSDPNVSLVAATKGTGLFAVSSNSGNTIAFEVAGSTTATDFLTVAPASGGGFPSINVAGSTSSLGLSLITKSGANVNIASSGGPGGIQFSGQTSGQVTLNTAATGGHLAIGQLNSGTPSLTAGCNGAGSSVTGNDTNGIVQGQTAAATTCTLTFGTAYTSAPRCVLQGNTAPLTGVNSASNSAITVNFGSQGSFFWSYICFGT